MEMKEIEKQILKCKQTLKFKEEEEYYLKREKELIDNLINNYDELSDNYIRASIELIHTWRELIEAKRLLLEKIEMVND